MIEVPASHQVTKSYTTHNACSIEEAAAAFDGIVRHRSKRPLRALRPRPTNAMALTG